MSFWDIVGVHTFLAGVFTCFADEWAYNSFLLSNYCAKIDKANENNDFQSSFIRIINTFASGADRLGG